MARKKKNPLGDFEDALNSLGFGGQEGGDSVTDIDNQDVVNQVLDDPNDDIDNLIPLCFDCHQRVGSYNPNHPKGTKYSVKELKSRRDDIYDKVRKGELPKQEVKILNAPAIVERRLKIEKDFKPIAQRVASENLFNPDIEFFSYVDILVTEYRMDSFFFESDLLCRLVELAEFLAEHTSPYRAIKPSDKNLTERLLELRKNFIEEYKRCFLIQM